MDIETLLPVIAFVAITTGFWAVWTIFNKKSSRAAERLEEWRDPFARQRRESTGGANTIFRGIEFAPIPAPGSVALLGLAGLVAGRRRR